MATVYSSYKLAQTFSVHLQEISDQEKGVGKREIKLPNRLAESTSDEGEGLTKKRQRSSKRKRLQLSDEESSEDDVMPSLKPHLPQYSEKNQPTLNTTSLTTQSSQVDHLPSTSGTTPSREVATDLHPIRGSTLNSTTDRTPTRTSEGRNTHLQNSPFQDLSSRSDLEDTKYAILEEVKRMLSQNTAKILEAIKERNFDDDPRENLSQLFPAVLTSVEEVEQFDNKLSEKSYRKAMVTELASLYANKDVKTVIRGVMRHLMTKKLMGEFSLRGSRGKKKSLFDTRLHGLIRGVARRFLGKEDRGADVVVNDTIAGVLKFAPHGEGGEKFKSRKRGREHDASMSLLGPNGGFNGLLDSGTLNHQSSDTE